MSKNKNRWNNHSSDRNSNNKNNGAEVFDDLEALADSDTFTDPIKDLDVDSIENEQEEASVDSKDESVLPEDDVNKKIGELEAALEKEKKEYLFLMADFDNYRKRVVKEKADLIKNASEKVLKGLLPIVDDFERGLQATKSATDAQAVTEGMELIYNKLVKYLGDNGVKAMETTDADFDPDLHEAIASIPTGDDGKKGKIIDTTQKGYMLNDKVLRHAKVVVGE